jgi:hypothetical protein
MQKKKEITKPKEKFNTSENTEKIKVEQVLVENFVSLQKVMTNLAVKFDSLSNQISKLLELFEISAKTLAEKGSLAEENKEDKKVVEKLDNLLEQNKIIAKGIALLHEQEPQNQNQQEQRYPPALQRNPMQQYPVPTRRIINTEEQQRQAPTDFSKNRRFGSMNT